MEGDADTPRSGRFDRGDQPGADPRPTPGHELSAAGVQDLLHKFGADITRRAIYETAVQTEQPDIAAGVSDVVADADRRLPRDGGRFISDAMALQRLMDADPLAGELILLRADQLQEEAKRRAKQPPPRRGLGVEARAAALLRKFNPNK